MQRRTVQDPQRTSSSAPHRGVRGTVAKPAPAARRPHRRRLARLAAALVAIAAGAGVLAGAPGSAGAQPGCEARSGPVAVVEVDGLLDPVLVDLVDDEIDRGRATSCALALVLQFDSGGAVVSDGELDRPGRRPRGRGGADRRVGRARRAARPRASRCALLAAADLTGVAPGSSIEVTPALARRPGASSPPTSARRTSATGSARCGRSSSTSSTTTPRRSSSTWCRLEGFETEVVGGRAPPGDRGALRRAQPDRPAHAHGGEPGGRLPAVRDRAGAAAVRAVHRRRRRRRGGRRGRAGARAATGWPSCRRARRRGAAARSPCSATASTCRPACHGCGRASPPSASCSDRCSCSTTACR